MLSQQFLGALVEMRISLSLCLSSKVDTMGMILPCLIGMLQGYGY